jgi:hypothetical protein
MAGVLYANKDMLTARLSPAEISYHTPGASNLQAALVDVLCADPDAVPGRDGGVGCRPSDEPTPLNLPITSHDSEHSANKGRVSLPDPASYRTAIGPLPRAPPPVT